MNCETATCNLSLDRSLKKFCIIQVKSKEAPKADEKKEEAKPSEAEKKEDTKEDTKEDKKEEKKEEEKETSKPEEKAVGAPKASPTPAGWEKETLKEK